MTDSDCTRRGEGRVPVRYRAPTLMLNTDREAGCYETSALPDECRRLVTGQAESDQCPECRGHGEHHPDCRYSRFRPNPEQGATVVKEGEYRFVPAHPLEHEPFTAECPGCCPVNVPLPLQARLLEAFLLDEWETALAGFIHQHRDEIVDMAFQGLREGHELYGSEMYGWDVERRTIEALMELRDCLNYLSSGEVR